MPLVYADRVQETTLTTGTGVLTLLGASSGFQSFSVIGVGNTTYYTIVDATTNAWEVGLGTVGISSLTRTSVLASSNANALVNFGVGSKSVFSVSPATFYATTLSTTGHAAINHTGLPGVPAPETFTAVVHGTTDHTGITGVGNLATAPGTGVVDHSTLNHAGIPGVGSATGSSGVDGPLTVLTGTVVEITGQKNYTTLTIQGTGILTTVAGRVLDIRAQVCDIQSTGKISGTGRGMNGGAGGIGALALSGGPGPSTPGGVGNQGANNPFFATAGHFTAAGGGGGGGGGGGSPPTPASGGAGGLGKPRALTLDGIGGGLGGTGGLSSPSTPATAGANGAAMSAAKRSLLLGLLQTSGLGIIYSGAGGSGGGGGSGLNGQGTAPGAGAGGIPSTQTGSDFGVGGAGGGPANPVNGFGGGAGGAGGANVFCGFSTLTMAVGARIESNGAAGGAGGGTAIGSGPGGGGSGGGAGIVYVRYSTGTNVDTTRCVAVGGLGAAPGTTSLAFSSTTGAAGGNGEDGIVIIQQV
jgi:hypothetical protein